MKIEKKKMFNAFEKNKLVNTNKIFGGDHKRPGGIAGGTADDAGGALGGKLGG